jgi:parvulin-like peptidyl-prolyl isomerase
VAELQEIKSAQPMAFEEAKEGVTENLQSTLAEQQAREQAFDLAATARQEKSVAKAARAHGKKIVSTDFFKKGDVIDSELGPSDALHKRAFQMLPGEISSVIPISDTYIIFQLMEKSSVDQKQFEQEKEQIREELTSRQRIEFFDNWLKNLTDRLHEEEQIQINQEVVDAVTGLGGVVDHTGHNH